MECKQSFLEDEGIKAAKSGLSEIRSKQNSLSNEVRSKKTSEIRSKTETYSSTYT